MSSIPPPSDTFRGRVSERTAKGIRLDGVPDLLIFSKYANGLIAPCRAGDVVTVELDDRAFIRTLVVEASERHEAHVDARQSCPVSSARYPDTDARIARSVALKAAVAFAASRPEMKAADVTKCAEYFERWLTREPPDD